MLNGTSGFVSLDGLVIYLLWRLVLTMQPANNFISLSHHIAVRCVNNAHRNVVGSELLYFFITCMSLYICVCVHMYAYEQCNQFSSCVQR